MKTIDCRPVYSAKGHNAVANIANGFSQLLCQMNDRGWTFNNMLLIDCQCGHQIIKVGETSNMGTDREPSID